MGLPVNCIVRNARRSRTDYLTELGSLDHEWILQLYGRRADEKPKQKKTGRADYK
jgi:hypothetical protein